MIALSLPVISPTFTAGMVLSLSLIMAIGPQNAHVLRMGLQRQHVWLTVAVCIVADVLLIALGVLAPSFRVNPRSISQLEPKEVNSNLPRCARCWHNARGMPQHPAAASDSSSRSCSQPAGGEV